jgi:two-component system cell cycle sensor histidine kinase/response regulator CckA
MWNQTSHQQPRVLVVDDEPLIRETVRRVLETSGYQVIEAANGLDGAANIETGGPVDLVIADLRMPGLDGAGMVCRIRAAHPDTKILYLSGFIDSLMDTRPLWEGEAFLEKPFTLVGLQEAVSLLLFETLTPPKPGLFARIQSRVI